jgi:hypothetical protein
VICLSSVRLLYKCAYVNLPDRTTNCKGEKGRLVASAEQSCKEQAGVPLRSIQKNQLTNNQAVNVKK